MSVTITLSHEIETLEALKDEWIDLQGRSSAKSMELSWHCIYIWYKQFNHLGELWIITARENDHLIGIAPLMKITVKPEWGFPWEQLEFIGASNYQEHLDFIIETGYEEQIIPLFIDELNVHRTRWDAINLTGLCETKTIDILQRLNGNWVENPEKNMFAPYIKLPDTVDEWMDSLSSKQRWRMRRDDRKLNEQFPNKWTITQVTQPDELDETFGHLMNLNRKRWNAVGEPGMFYSEEITKYFRELMSYMLENGWLRLYRLDIDGQPAAINFCCHYYGRAYGHITGADRDITNVALGIVLKNYCFEQAIIEGCREFTLMEGNQSYKYSFGAADRVHKALQLFRSPRIPLQIKTVKRLRRTKSRIRIRSRIQGVKSRIQEIVSDAPENEVSED